jgi:hypothetical protein
MSSPDAVVLLEQSASPQVAVPLVSTRNRLGLFWPPLTEFLSSDVLE